MFISVKKLYQLMSMLRASWTYKTANIICAVFILYKILRHFAIIVSKVRNGKIVVRGWWGPGLDGFGFKKPLESPCSVNTNYFQNTQFPVFKNDLQIFKKIG